MEEKITKWKHYGTMTTFGHYIAALREAKGWTQRELAKRVKCSHTTISKIESDGFKQPSLDLIIALAKAFKVPVGSLIQVYQGKEPDFKEIVDKESLRQSLHFAIDKLIEKEFP